ncbi:MAG: dTDP-glucose 4,6-dehydratase [Actinobacteria bacterium]|nr:dTDP-glucose 4,6-dehydratase [Actinomycetota bacterium]
MHLLVTGGAGFIGSHFVDLILAETDHTVTVLDKLTYAGNLDNLAQHGSNGRLRFVRGDICEPAAADPLVGEADRVVNFAAESFVDRSIESSREFVLSNVLGTQVLLEACRRDGTPMLQVSTDEVYGSIRRGAFREGDPLEPNSPYAATKAGAELLCRSYFVTYGLPVTAVRGSNAYGPRQHPEKAIPVYVAAALSGRPIPVYGDGSNRREWLYVEDFADAVRTVLDAGEPGETYNIGGGHESANLDLAREICALTGADESLIKFVDDRPGHDFRYSLEWGRLRALGWEPRRSFRDALATTVAWFTAHPDRLEVSR